MKKKLIGIFVCMLLITIVLPITSIMAVETEKESESSLNFKQNISDYSISIFRGNHSDKEKRLGCYGMVINTLNEGILFDNISFIVKSYNFQGELIGESFIYKEDLLLTSDSHLNLRIIPESYGEIFTWVKATLDVNNGEQTQTRIGLSIGKWIHFFRILL